MKSQTEILGNDDVVSDGSAWLTGSRTYTVEEFLEVARGKVKLNGETCDEAWLVHEEGGKVLRVGESQGWRQGQIKVRIKVMLEFEPDALPENSLDDAANVDESPLDALRT
jgi:hypothetical protein